MQFPKEECVHISQVLKQAKKALIQKNSLQLKALSNQTIHDACNYQDPASITLATLLYALSKLIERNDFKKIRNWDLLVKKFSAFLDLAIKALGENDHKRYSSYVEQARKSLENQSVVIKPYIESVIQKAAINKGSKIYEHGISQEQTAKLLGISQWEIAEYLGQKASEVKQNQTINIKQRAKMALEFFG
jgi:predicted XRE-type DNA-binding protein